MIVLGIDGGLAALGWAAVRLEAGGEVLEGVGVIVTAPSARKRGVLAADDTVRRARELHRALSGVVGRYGPAVLAIEAFSAPRHAGSAAKVAMSVGVVASIAEALGLPIVSASPQEVKRAATGRQDASKEDVARAVCERWRGAAELLAGVRAGLREHAADAAAVVLATLEADTVRMARRLAVPPCGPCANGLTHRHNAGTDCQVIVGPVAA